MEGWDFLWRFSRLSLTYAGLIAAAGVVWVVGVVIYRLTLHPLAKYPGPLLGKITSLYGAWHTLRQDIHIDMLHCHDKYDVYGYGKPTRKAAAYHQFPTNYSYSTHNMVNKALHQRKRKLVQQAFSPDAMKIWLHTLQRQLDIMCDALSRNIVPGQGEQPKTTDGWGSPQMMSQWCLCLLTDVVMDGVFSTTWSTITSTANWYMLDLVHSTYEWLGLIFQCPKLSAWGLDKYVVPGLCRSRARLRKIFGGVLIDRLEARTTKGDIYDVFLNAKNPDTGEGWPVPELGAEALLLFGAGPDATSSSMSAALFYITLNRDVYAKVVAEVRSAFGSADAIIPGAALTSCRYLHACIDEAQRRNPANGSALWRELETDAFVDGERLPAGTDVGTPIYAIHHNPRFYPDPFVYKPERWIVSDDNPQAQVDLALSAWNPFSIGPRGCVGRPVANLQLQVSLARLYWQFDMQFASDPSVASIGCGSPDAEYGRHRPDEFQTRCSFQNSVKGPMLQLRDRTLSGQS